MELLLSGVHSQISQIFPNPPPARQIYICPWESIDELADKLNPHSTHFGLFLVMDAQEIESKRLGKPAATLLKKGLAYLCAWDPDCKRVHDTFDTQDLARKLERDTHDVIMTTWHNDESLEEALWFFVHSAFPAADYVRGCNDWVIAPIANRQWEREIREKIRKVAFEQLEN